METWRRTYRAVGLCDPAVHFWVRNAKPFHKWLVDGGVCPEIAVRDELVQRPGWDAVWIRRGVGLPLRFWRSMPPNLGDPRAGGALERDLPAWPASLLDRIDPNWRRNGGVPDVFAWNEATREVRFVEVKRRGKDKLRANQLAFIEAGKRAGFRADAFVVVEWDGAPEQIPAPR